jgi:signal transduction histidine kinase
MSFINVLRRMFFSDVHERNVVTRYLLPIVAVVFALQINWLAAPFLSLLPPFLAFLAAIMVTAWYGGFPSAVFATVLSAAIINFYFIPPLYSFNLNLADWGTLGLFALEAMTMAYCLDYLRKNESHLRRANLDLEQEVIAKGQALTNKEEKLRDLMYQLAATEERERRQLAAELHDYLAQLLTLARMKIKQAQQHAKRSNGEVNRYIGETDALLHKSTDYVRTLMAELYPAQLHELGFPAALRWLAGQMPRHGLDVDMSITTDSVPTLTTDQSLLLYQSVRELLMNIVKHAGVSRAVVTLDADTNHVSITVKDHGKGFNPSTLVSTISGHHFGLQSVRERMTAMGGSFLVESLVGKGTSVTVSVPLQLSSDSERLRAARTIRQDRVGARPAADPNQASLGM